MKSSILVLLIAGLNCSSIAQPVDSLWSRMLGGTGSDICSAVLETEDGGFILAGRTNYSATDVDAWLVKTNTSGDVVWSRMIGGGLSEMANDVVIRSGGGYGMVGYTLSYGAGESDVYFGTVSEQGDIQDLNYWGGTSNDIGNDLAPTNDGGFIIGGETSSFGAGSADFWLIKTNETGTQQWTQTFGGTESDVCYAVQQVSGDGYALAGYTSSFGSGGADAWLVRVSSTGQILWSRTFGYATNDVAYDMIQTSDGGFALAGHTQSAGTGDRDFYVVKTDGNGTLQWSHTYGGDSDEFCYSIQQTSDGGYILTGSTYSFGTGTQDIWLVRLSSNGTILWSRTFGGMGAEDCQSVAITSNGGFALGGATTSFGAIEWDIWLVRTGIDPALDVDGFYPVTSDFTLHPIYPNPFNNTANIRFDLPREVTGKLVVYDVLGRMTNTLFDGKLTAGSHQMQFNGNNLSTGIYFIRLETPAFTATQKAVLLK